MTEKQYLLFSGHEVSKEISANPVFVNFYEFLLVVKTVLKANGSYTMKVYFTAAKKIDQNHIFLQADYLFFNSPLLSPIFFKTIFKNRKGIQYEFSITAAQANYLKQVIKTISTHTPTCKRRYEDLFVKSTLNHLILYFITVVENNNKIQFSKKNTNSIKNTVVQRFNKLLKQHYKTEKKLDFYTDTLAISSRTLANYSKAVTGKSPKQLMDDYIVAEAVYLLQNTDWSVKEISIELGFNEVNNFYTFFKKHLKSTPKAFREKR